jgi:hypothetical protein
MKNVMARAWEIAKVAVVKFGGKVRQYFVEALRQAWKEAKNAARFGFAVIQKVNGVLYFGVDADVEIVEYTQERSGRTGKLFTKRTVIRSSRTGINKATGKAAAIYSIAMGTYSFVFGGVATLEINNGKLTWVA